jgi:hypothetical protein
MNDEARELLRQFDERMARIEQQLRESARFTAAYERWLIERQAGHQTEMPEEVRAWIARQCEAVARSPTAEDDQRFVDDLTGDEI